MARRIFKEIPKPSPELKRLLTEPSVIETSSLLGDSPEAAQQIKEAILRIDQAMQQIMKSGITQWALIVLIHDMTSPSVPKLEIKRVLDSLHRLKKEYLVQE